MLKLDNRKQAILKTIVEDYFENAEPVGSRTIWRSYIHDLSPATIRNEMADLEAAGLIRQPHTSAGRIPTDTGYRYYVDNIMKLKKLSTKEEQIIKAEYKNMQHDMDEVLSQSLNVLSELCDYTVFSIVPSLYKSALKVIQLILLDIHKVLLVVLTSSGTNNIVVSLPEASQPELTQEDLNKISRLLTGKLSGMTAGKINEDMLSDITREMPRHKKTLSHMISLIHQNLASQQEDKLVATNMSNLLKQPEYMDTEQMRDMLELLEHDKTLLGVFKHYLKDEGITIKIGSENKMRQLSELSVIITPCHSDEETIGGLGIIGPKRMGYSHMTSIMEAVHNEIAHILGAHDE